MVSGVYKTCSSCLVDKPIENFIKQTKGCKYGRGAWCKECRSKYKKHKRSQLTDQEKEVVRLRSAEYRKRNPEKAKWSVRKAQFKKLGLEVSKEDYDQLFEQQSGTCAICDNPASGFKKHLCMDHCHETLRLRGLLCDNCNSGLGKFKDNVELLEKAIVYLKKHDN